jgi:hypothetical protein
MAFAVALQSHVSFARNTTSVGNNLTMFHKWLAPVFFPDYF